MKGGTIESVETMRQGIREHGRLLLRWTALGMWVLLGLAPPARASSAMTELSAGGDVFTWTLMGDVELRRDETFLTLGYTGARLGSDADLSHLLSAGVDQALSEHWLLSGVLTVGLPRVSSTVLVPERPLRNLPALVARTGNLSQGVLLSAMYDSAGFSNVEYGVDVGLGLTRYALDRQVVARDRQGVEVITQRKDPLWVTRASVGGRLLLFDRWELGLRGGLWLYSGDPLRAGQFTPEEVRAAGEHYLSEVSDRDLLLNYERLLPDLGAILGGRMMDAATGFPSAPTLFDLKPSVTYRVSEVVRGQLSYGYIHYVPGQGYAHVLATRWTFRAGDSWRFWGTLSLQSDHLEGEEPWRSGLLSVGSEYSF